MSMWAAVVEGAKDVGEAITAETEKLVGTMEKAADKTLDELSTRLPDDFGLSEKELASLPDDYGTLETELTGLPDDFDLYEVKLTSLPDDSGLSETKLIGLPNDFSSSENELSGLSDDGIKKDILSSGFDENTERLEVSENIEKAKSLDDNGKPYMENGALLPNTTYQLNGNTYITDEKGRIIHTDAQPKNTPENVRDVEAQKQAGGGYRKPGDQGGHIIGRDLNGNEGAGNLVAMDSNINNSDYKRMENDVKNALKDGKEVSTQTDLLYSGESERPDRIVTTVTVDGKKTVYAFDNNMDGSLLSNISENAGASDLANVKSVLSETDGQISSVKREYSDTGELVKTTVNITYPGENSKNYRRTVVIDGQKGDIKSE